MLSPFMALLLWFLPSGGISVSCQTTNGGIYGKPTNESESWTISCLSENSSNGLYRYEPLNSVTVVPPCGTSANYTITATRTRISTGVTATMTTTVGVAWLCKENENFDSSFTAAAVRVGSSPAFWSLFGIALGAGMFLGSVWYGIRTTGDLLDGGEKDA